MDFLYSLFKLYTGDGHVASAALAKDADVAADTKDREAFLTAGVRLFQLKNIADVNLWDVGHDDPPVSFHSYLNYITNTCRSKENL